MTADHLVSRDGSTLAPNEEHRPAAQVVAFYNERDTRAEKAADRASLQSAAV